MVTSCRALLRSSLTQRADLDLLDSTQISNPPPSLPVRALLAVRRVCSFVCRLERRRPDAVILFVAVGASVIEKGVMAAYARLRGIPALMFPRGGAVIDACRTSAFTRRWVRAAFAGASMVLCQGPKWREFARDVLGFAESRLLIIDNWTATPELLDLAAHPARKIQPLRLLFVGWLDREKGSAELLQACALLAPRHGFELHFAGEGNYSAAAREFVRAHGLEDRVRFRGWLGETGLQDEYANADIFVLPSWAEGLPNAMIEAMAAGLACVVSAVGNVPDVVTDEREALLVPPREIAALAVALERLLVDRPLRDRLASAAHEFAAARFGVERASDAILRAVASITNPVVGG
jgi:glycosyltransferase involved in cell wall biosynthesis